MAENGQDWLTIARSFKPSEESDHPSEHTKVSISDTETYEIDENNEKRAAQENLSPLSVLADEYLSERQQITQALGIQEDTPGDYDHKATIAGGIPPYEAALARQEWLAGIDWRYGLRCGKDGHQCRACKGIPCHDSTAWQGEGGHCY